MEPRELVKIQAYMRKVFGAKTLSVRARPKIKDSAEVYIGDEFVGQVNAFPAQITDGWATVGNTRLPAPDFLHLQDTAAIAYIRPHEIAVSSSPSANDGELAVEVEDCMIAGPIMRLDTRLTGTGEALQIELPRSRTGWSSSAPIASSGLCAWPCRGTIQTVSPQARSAPPRVARRMRPAP